MGNGYERVDTEEEGSLSEQNQPGFKQSTLRQWKTPAFVSFLLLCTGIFFFFLGAQVTSHRPRIGFNNPRG
jgi:hypothetical protein